MHNEQILSKIPTDRYRIMYSCASATSTKSEIELHRTILWYEHIHMYTVLHENFHRFSGVKLEGLLPSFFSQPEGLLLLREFPSCWYRAGGGGGDELRRFGKQVCSFGKGKRRLYSRGLQHSVGTEFSPIIPLLKKLLGVSHRRWESLKKQSLSSSDG